MQITGAQEASANQGGPKEEVVRERKGGPEQRKAAPGLNWQHIRGYWREQTACETQLENLYLKPTLNG